LFEDKIIQFNYSLVLIKLGEYFVAIKTLDGIIGGKNIDKIRNLNSDFNYRVAFQKGYVLGLLGLYGEADQWFDESIRLYEERYENELGINKIHVETDTLRQKLFVFFRESRENQHVQQIKSNGNNNLESRISSYHTSIFRKFADMVTDNDTLKTFPYFYNTYAYP
jgi:tetratricopeptide (TPR) repeat protein